MTLAEGVARLGTRMPFAQAASELTFFWGVELEETTVRRYTQAAGVAYVAEQTAAVERLERERPAAPAGPTVQYLSADGAMVPLVAAQWAEVKTLAIGEVKMGRATESLPEAHTTNLTCFSRLADADTFTRQAYVEAYQRGTESARVVCGRELVRHSAAFVRPDGHTVQADRVYVPQILANLLIKASNYSPQRPTIHVRARREVQMLRVDVEDQGPGIPAEQQVGLFEPYVRARSGDQPAGFGLGLAIARDIVEAHAGRIGLESHPGAGTRVWFTLPLAEA